MSVSAGPSTQILSLLTARNGSLSISGAALNQPAAGFHQQVALVRDHDLEPVRAAREMRFERVRQIVDVDDHLLHARGAQLLEHMIEQRLAGDLDQRLGPGRGQRAHPLAETGSHDHRRMRHLGRAPRRASARPASSGSCRLLPRLARGARGGMLASNQSRTGFRCGCSRSRSSRPHIRGWKRR